MSERIWIVERWSRDLNLWQQWSAWYVERGNALTADLIYFCQQHPGRAHRIARYVREE